MKFSLKKTSRKGVIVDYFHVTLPDTERPVINLFSAVDQGFDRWAPTVTPAMRSIKSIAENHWLSSLRDGIHDLEVILCQ